MEAIKTVKYFLLCGAAYFTALCGVILVVLAIITAENANVGVEPSKFLLVLALSYVWALGSTARRCLSSQIAGLIVNAICYIGGLFAFLMLFDINLIPSLIATLFFAVIYAAVVLCKSFVNKKGGALAHAKKKASEGTANQGKQIPKAKKDEKKPYENMFS
ncbi:MAG: hypothetical protein IJC64_02605 [Clostridia bacterium]|nr:hypothetical protein [Clostridia bacterium]